MTGMAERGYQTGIVFSVHHSYRQSKDLPYQLHPLYFDHPPIFDNQPKATGSIPFQDMKEEEALGYISSFYRTFEKLTQTDGYELIHVQHGMYIGYAAALIKEKYHVPYFISLHAMELNFLENFPDPIMAMKAMTDADCILALSEAQKQRLLKEYTKDRIIELDMRQHGFTLLESESRYMSMIGNKSIRPHRVKVCPLGIDTNRFNIKSYEYGDGISSIAQLEDPKVVMFAGRLIEMKGIKQLLEAEAIYNKDGDVFTIILGGGELEKYVSDKGRRRNNIWYLGFKEQNMMPYYLNFVAEHNGVFTVPSSSEGMSLVYLEAMACGARVLACCKKDMGGMDFMQLPYARFSTFGDVKQLASTILTMLHEKPLSRSAIRSNMHKYDVPHFLLHVRSLYQDQLGKNN